METVIKITKNIRGVKYALVRGAGCTGCVGHKDIYMCRSLGSECSDMDGIWVVANEPTITDDEIFQVWKDTPTQNDPTGRQFAIKFARNILELAKERL